ncbi:HDR074Wp [Eremothecium sinecaudum]|uniref:TATA-binding protein-associated factor mot1 n=1 Tax=Eremothecium sinecaudum TaxID=45286 RepID=A0A0X8HS29_9SACH|nr:HDR074Wp [Eremothecium sinecaudum]AMD20816.1 HDR074Wp [Eremothecium sinecaudum]
MTSRISRLDRQVILVETGSTQAVRNVAADQLGDLAKQHPEEILSLLSRVYPYLMSKKWETRVTAARAVGGIVSHAKIWNPNEDDSSNELQLKENPTVKNEDSGNVKLEEDVSLKLEELENSNMYSLSEWNLGEILKSEKTLLAANLDDYNAKDPETKKQQVCADYYAESRDVKRESSEPPGSPTSSKTSARMMAMAKRRRKIQAKSTSKKPLELAQTSVSRTVANAENSTNGNETAQNTEHKSPSELEAMQLHNPKMEITEQTGSSKIMIESVVAPLLERQQRVSGLVWQFQEIFELLLENLMHESWECRHGASLGIREIVKRHGKAIGRIWGKTKEENDARNVRALEDLAARLLTIFALDRFGDFVNDTVVAPVRESATQALGALLIHLDDSLSVRIFNALEELVLQDPKKLGSPNKIWEATHGGLLGIRYFVSIKTDLLFKRQMLDNVVKIVLYGLNERDDDVQSVAAAILTPVTSEFIKLDSSTIDMVVSAIWNSLDHLDDDLSSSVASVMDLLAKLCQHQEVLDVLYKKASVQPAEWSFKALVPKLYPFLRNSITNVRRSVLNLFKAFLSIKDEMAKHWIHAKNFRLLFQNLLLEQHDDILQLSFEVYCKMLSEYKLKSSDKTLDHIFSKHLAPILHLLITPIGEQGKNYNMETQYILKPSQHYQFSSERKRSNMMTMDKSHIPAPVRSEHVNIDALMIAGDVTLLGSDVIFKTRVLAAKALGHTLASFQESTVKSFLETALLSCLDLPYATPRMLVAIIVAEYCSEWLKQHDRASTVPAFVSSNFSRIFMEHLSDPSTLPVFRELVPSLKALRTQCQGLLTTFVDVGMLPPQRLPQLAIIVKGEAEAGPEAFYIETAEKVYNEYYEKMFNSLSNSNKLLAKKPLEDAGYRVHQAIESAKEASIARNSHVLASYASATLLFDGLPKKLNPVIRSLMDSIKEEKFEVLQYRSGDSIVYLITELVKNQKINVANKVVKNLCGFLCVDTAEVPEFAVDHIYTDSILTLLKESTILAVQDNAAVKKLAEEAHIKRRGALYTLSHLFEKLGAEALNSVPQLKHSIFDPIDSTCKLEDNSGEVDFTLGQKIVDALGVLRALFNYMDSQLQEEYIFSKLPNMLAYLRSKYSVIRYAAARTLSSLASTNPIRVMPFIIKRVLPLVNNAGSITDRQSGVELIYHLCESMGTEILPYIVFLVVPLLGRMSDYNGDVRNLATTTFASIIKLVPLEEGISDPKGLPQDLLEGREKERDFIQQMMDPSKAKPFNLPVAVKATLRKYQQDGINWLAFLNKYHLHGILCDDMGLGKTLQTICIIASDQYLRQQEYNKTKSVEKTPLASLIVCPPSLTGHWEQEIEQYAPFLKVLVYAGGPSARFPLREKLGEADIVVTSYDVTRNDIDIITKYEYNYCVLDEGHIIKNSQSKLAKAVKLIRANHRLILTGTPIQNNVVELWSLFDFLMPGFLGSEKAFQERFAKPIAASRNSKSSSKEQEAGALALEALHKQVLPFMLRRLKEDVLSDLPPKIIQDYYCELSDLQRQLYKDFAKKQKNIVEKDIENPVEIENKQHIFQALQYMRKLCNHPSLILNKEHPQYDEVEAYLAETGTDLHDIAHAPKLGALRNLLLECGIGIQDVDNGSNSMTGTESVISQHRALIFCQLKDMLDMVENDLLRKYMPSVTYMRLDGSVESRDRQKVVRTFNEDPSIDCLLLTTKVGGLGLNLTGADTVIFIEHDWNPMNDLQAMDRAHRLGQKKVVNVYRIITKGSLEEKIMGLQKFKMNIASTVVNQQNAGLASMDTHQLLDLFDTDSAAAQHGEEKPATTTDEVANETGLTGKAKEAVTELKELWDSSQYEEEYNLDNFIKTLR